MTPTPVPTPAPSPPTPLPPVPDAPMLTCPASVTLGATSAAGAPVTFAAPVVTGGAPPVTVTCSVLSGSTFPVGSTTVQCTATDAMNRTASCRFSITVTPPPRILKTHFMAFGDSITSGEVTFPVSGATTSDGFPAFRLALVPSAAYPTVLGDLLVTRYSLQSQAIRVTNQGKPGEATRDAVARFLDVYYRDRPEVLLLMEGYNDINGSGNAGQNAAIEALNTMAAEARNRGTRVFVATLAPSRPGSRMIPLATVQAYNEKVRAMVRGEGAVLVDVYEALLSDVNTYIGVDGLHPTEIGYRKIAETFFAAVRADLEAR